ncbi:MAG: APA family basic amino acid/polyamine antiporter [Planctomycetota bacterium]|jgi:APA family basic amino acid/polyamine antiporter
MSQPHTLLRRDLGSIGAYATMIGTLVGAGIFRVTSDAWVTTGASVILGYLVLSPVILATSVPYAAFASTSLGESPGGEYSHFSETFGDFRLAFCGVWLKIISYLGAQAYLSIVFADYLMPLVGLGDQSDAWRTPIALGTLTFFLIIHLFGVRWFGRIQVAMCVVLAFSIAVLVIPGVFAIKATNYQPFFLHGTSGFLSSLPMLFFAYAGFESVAHAAGEVKDSRINLPRVFLRGILLTTAIFLSMSIVTFGVLPGEVLSKSGAPMADVAAQYLPSSAAWIITIGALAALATSINGSMLVPARLGLMLARDELAPKWAGKISTRTRIPWAGLLFCYGVAATLVLTGQVGLALGTAILALTLLYFIHSGSLFVLESRRPDLFKQANESYGRTFLLWSAGLSLVALGILIGVQVFDDVGTVLSSNWVARFKEGHLTGTELVVGWGILGALIFRFSGRK